MKKILSITLFTLVLVLSSGVAMADTAKKPTAHLEKTGQKPAQKISEYTSEQQTCMNDAAKTEQTATKSAQDAFNAATKDALQTKRAAMKSAQDAFNAATKDALQTKENALKAAQTIEDAKDRAAAIKTANDAYNNDETVKQALEVYKTAVKTADDAYNNDETVKQAKIPYEAALKTAEINIKEQCIGKSGKSAAKSFLQPAKNLPNEPDISSVSAIPDINVAYGTALDAVNLPTTVAVTFSDNTIQNIAITWGGGMTAYNPNQAGTYVFSGTLTLPDNTTNNNNLKAAINVIVAPQSTPTPTSTSTPSADPAAATSNLINQAASSLLNGFWNIIKQTL